jgi:hypothetical protein
METVYCGGLGNFVKVVEMNLVAARVAAEQRTA